MGPRLNSYMYALTAIIFGLVLTNCAENRGFRAHKTNEKDLVQAAKLKRLQAGRGQDGQPVSGQGQAPAVPGAARADGAKPPAPVARPLTDADRQAAAALRQAQEQQRRRDAAAAQGRQESAPVAPNPKLIEISQSLSTNTDENYKFHKETITGLTVVKRSDSAANRLSLGIDVLVVRAEKEEIHAATGVLAPGDKISEGKLVQMAVQSAFVVKPAFQANLTSQGVEVYGACRIEDCTEVQVLVQVTVGEKKAALISVYKIGADNKFALVGVFPHGVENLKTVDVAQLRSEGEASVRQPETTPPPPTPPAADASGTASPPAAPSGDASAGRRQAARPRAVKPPATPPPAAPDAPAADASAPTADADAAPKAPMLVIETGSSQSFNGSASTSLMQVAPERNSFASGVGSPDGNLFPEIGNASRTATIDLGTGTPVTIELPAASTAPAVSAPAAAPVTSGAAARTRSTYGQAANTANNANYHRSVRQQALQQNREDRRAGRQRMEEIRSRGTTFNDLIGK